MIGADGGRAISGAIGGITIGAGAGCIAIVGANSAGGADTGTGASGGVGALTGGGAGCIAMGLEGVAMSTDGSGVGIGGGSGTVKAG